MKSPSHGYAHPVRDRRPGEARLASGIAPDPAAVACPHRGHVDGKTADPQDLTRPVSPTPSTRTFREWIASVEAGSPSPPDPSAGARLYRNTANVITDATVSLP
ncbi:hypothetical protein SALBM311S_11907 [Streptomyces alboniger]